MLEDVGSLLLEHQRQSTELHYMAHLVAQEVEHWLGKEMVEHCTGEQLGAHEWPHILKRHHSGHLQCASLSSACCAGLRYPPQGPAPEIIVVMLQ